MFAGAARIPRAKAQYQSVPVPIVGPSSQGELSKLGPQRSINWYPVKPERDGDPWILRGRPGLELLATLARSEQRGWHVFNDRLFIVAGARVYEVRQTGTIYEWGKISTTRGRVVMATLEQYIIIGDGSGYHAFDTNTGTIATIPDAPRGRFCVAFNQRILYQGENGAVFYSEVSDPTNIPGLNFFNAESLPDEIVAITTTEDQIWLHGADSTEVWYDSGDTDNPFRRINGGTVYSGCGHPFTALRLDNSVWWVENDKDGRGVVRRSSGFTPQRVSTSAVERFTQASQSLTAYSYQEEGHTFYALNSELGTWAYDLKTQEWHERAWLNRETGEQERHRPEFHAWVYGQHYVGDYDNGNVYRQGLDLHSDAGQEVRRTRVTQRISFGGRSVIIPELWLDFATGVGLDGASQGTEPMVMLRVSGDGASFGYEITAPLGGIGAYNTQVRFFGLGLGRDWVFEISVSDPVVTGLMGGEALIARGER